MLLKKKNFFKYLARQRQKCCNGNATKNKSTPLTSSIKTDPAQRNYKSISDGNETNSTDSSQAFVNGTSEYSIIVIIKV